ncbi:DNA topoisomerase, partial [Cardiobacterium valvarum]
DGVPGQQQATFAARGQEMIFAGWMRLAQGGDETGEKKSEGGEDASSLLPLLRVGDLHTPQDGRVLELETKPLGRFSEAGLVKKLEAEGIGRPATYAAIIGTLTGKGYVETVNRFFVPSTLGEAIVNGLRNRFDFMEVHYTRDMEDELDAIAAGKADYQQVVAHYDQALDGQLAQFAQVELPRFAGAGTEDSATYPCPD